MSTPIANDFTVGGIIRTPRPRQQQDDGNNKKRKMITGKAIISSIDTDEQTVSLLWDPFVPKPLEGVKKRSKNPPTFLVAPSMNDNNDDMEEQDHVPFSSLQTLESFEVVTAEDKEYTLLQLKEYGDLLFAKIRDPWSALSYYEEALAVTSLPIPQIGSTIIIKKNGYPILADVDCIDMDDQTMDISYYHNDDDGNEEEEVEETISFSRMLLCLYNNTTNDTNYDKIQERILLNMARCLHMVVEYYDASNTTTLRNQYLNSIIKACTLAMACAKHTALQDEKDESSSTTISKARYLRSKAYFEMNKFLHAKVDVKYILHKIDPNDKAAAKLLKDIQTKEIQIKKSNKKLAKEVCSWVNEATSINENITVSEEEEEDGRDHGRTRERQQQRPYTAAATVPTTIHSSLFSSIFISRLWYLFSLCLLYKSAMIFMELLQKNGFGKKDDEDSGRRMEF